MIGAITRPALPGPLRWFATLVDYSVIAIGATLALLVFTNVVLHAFSRDLAWVTELGELLMVWVTFLGGACAALRGQHMTITEFIDKLQPAARRWGDAAVQGLCLAVLAQATHFGIRLVQANWGNELTVLGWPMALQYMGMAVGCAVMTLFVGWDLVQILRGVGRESRYGLESA